MLDSAIAYTDSAWQLAEKLDYQTGKMLATLSYAYIDKEKSDYKLALSRFQEYVDYWHTKGDSVEMANGLDGMGLIYNYLDDFDYPQTAGDVTIEHYAVAAFKQAPEKPEVSVSSKLFNGFVEFCYEAN
jgi:hypothetical protein